MSIIFCIGGGGVAADIDPCYRVAYPLSFTSLESKLSWASSENFEEHGNMAHLTVVVVKTVPT